MICVKIGQNPLRFLCLQLRDILNKPYICLLNPICVFPDKYKRGSFTPPLLFLPTYGVDHVPVISARHKFEAYGVSLIVAPISDAAIVIDALVAPLPTPIRPPDPVSATI